MAASPELTHYLSAPAQDAPSGGAGIKQVEVRGGLCSAKRGGEKLTEAVRSPPEGLLGVRTGHRHMEANRRRQLRSPCSDDS